MKAREGTVDGDVIGRFLRAFTKDQSPTELLVLASRDPETQYRSYRRFLVASVETAAQWCIAEANDGNDVYYKTALIKPDSTRMVKEGFQDKVLWLWADLDAMDPATLPVTPTFLILSSPGRYQALWRLTQGQDKWDAERWCRALARFGDASGWDIGQELRVPGTINYKYEDKPVVLVQQYTQDSLVTFELLENRGLVSVDTPGDILEGGPDGLPEPWDGPVPDYAAQVLAFSFNPDGEGRSGALWSVLNQLRDEGWTANDAFQMMWWSPLNKFRMDGRPPRDLWRDVANCWRKPRVESNQIRIAKLEPVHKVDLSQIHKIGWWPALCQIAIDTFRGPTLFSDEVIVLMFLSSYSVTFPQLRVQGSNVGLWTLLLGKQAAGKSTLIQGLSTMCLDAMPSLNIVTSGSPEGIMEMVSTGPTLLSFEEYSEQLKQMAKRDGYAVTNKEVYQRMFDGAPLGHATRKKGITAGSTFAVMTASTNVDTWRKYGDPEDMANGYLSRFVVLADNLVDRSINRNHLGRQLELLRAAVRERVSLAMGVVNVELSNMSPSTTPDTLGVGPLIPGYEISEGDYLFLEYQNQLESLWEKSFDLDERSAASAFDVPPGRTLTKARKIAALLELAEQSPQVYGDALYVRDRNTRLAIELANRSMLWAQRAIDWLQESKEKDYVDRILNTLGNAHPEWMRPWDIAVRLRGLRAFEVKSLLRTLHESGLVEMQRVKRENGQTSELWRLSK